MSEHGWAGRAVADGSLGHEARWVGRPRRWLITGVLAVALAASGCSSDEDPHGGEPGTDSGTNPGTDSGTNPGTDSGTNPGTDSGTDAALPGVPMPPTTCACPDPDAPSDRLEWSYKMDAQAITVNSGEETLSCDAIPVDQPPTPRPVYLLGMDTDVASPNHHEVLFFSTTALDNQRCCSGTGNCKISVSNFFDALLGLNYYNSLDYIAWIPTGEGEKSWRFPRGEYGISLGETGEGQWVTNRHIINWGSEPVTVPASYTAHVSDYVHFPTAMAQAENLDIRLEPGETKMVSGTMTATFPMDVVWFGTHMHNRGVKAEIWFYDGEKTADEPFYVSTDWDSPEVLIPAEPIHLEPGQGLTYGCTFHNYENYTVVHGSDTGQELQGQAEFEMCLMWINYAYPRCSGYAGKTPPNLGNFQHTNGQVSEWTYPQSGWYYRDGDADQNRHESNLTAAQAACPAAF